MKTSRRNLYAKCAEFCAKFIATFKNDLRRPAFLANSNAVGVFCAFLPMIGQGYICFLLWIASRKFKATKFSLTISLAWTLITNPLVMPFVLYAYYKIGTAMTGEHALSLAEFLRDGERIVRRATDWETALADGMRFALDELGRPMLLGASISVIVISVAAYIVTYVIAKRFSNDENTARKNR